MKKKSHVKDTQAKKRQPSYQSTRQQGMRQGDGHDGPAYSREDLGFTNRDTRGYDKEHKGNY
ncbi:MAG TPA: hypothetical protein VF412_18875 [Bdellovibrio sp.]|uniref:hypothetical protein n=1 Tax=Bdellovibrio sp. TaxID=28201 RepID=UPI002F164377